MQISIQDMMDNAVHYGHKTSRWNPKIRPYIFGKHNNIHIFDLHKTAQKMKEAMEFLAREVSQGKTVLFVATKPQAGSIVKELCKDTSMPYVTEKWLCGLLTNFDTIKNRIRYYQKIKEMEKSGEIEKYTKKERGNLHKEMEKLETMLGGVSEMRRRPDIMFVIDTYREKNALREAQKLGIKTVGIVDTNGDPESVDMPIPANDDALKSLNYILNIVKETISTAKKGKKAE